MIQAQNAQLALANLAHKNLPFVGDLTFILKFSRYS